MIEAVKLAACRPIAAGDAACRLIAAGDAACRSVATRKKDDSGNIGLVAGRASNFAAPYPATPKRIESY